MKPLNILRGTIVVILMLKAIFLSSQINCETEEPYLLTHPYSIPTFIQLYNGGYCITGFISDTTVIFGFYPNGENGIIYWGFSSPLGYELDVINISIYDSDCQLISDGQLVDGLYNTLYFVQFDLKTIYIDNFCPFFLPINPLAVTFGLIEAKQIENSIVVEWVTLSESNSHYFTIQYSHDLNIWYSTRSIPSSKNSSTNRYYVSNFTPSFSGMVYIRIAEYDYNGVVDLSEIIYCVFIPKSSSTLIYDLSGRLIGIRNF
jgi:hypothetical protein